jgi:hypothetical protein
VGGGLDFSNIWYLQVHNQGRLSRFLAHTMDSYRAQQQAAASGGLKSGLLARGFEVISHREFKSFGRASAQAFPGIIDLLSRSVQIQ